MKPEQVVTDEPSAAEVARRADELPPPPAEVLGDLRRLLQRSEEPLPEAEWPPILAHARAKLDSRYAEPATSHRGPVALPLVYAKRAFRLAFQPLINEVLRKQVEFNEAILAALVQIFESVQHNVRNQARWRDEISRRVAKLEARATDPRP